ncbi:MAG: MFS transporter, partial [Omnitrophica WOR_2 bacterium]
MKFNYTKIFLLGFGYFAISVVWAIYNAFVPVFLANKFHLEPALIGFYMALDNIAALLVQPPVGLWSDRVRTSIGRRLPFILVGAPAAAVVFGLVPFMTFFPLFVACTVSFMLSMAFWRTPFFTLMPDITPSEYRSQANGILNFMGGAGAILAFLGGSVLYRLNPSYPFWLGSGISILVVALLLVFIREPEFIAEKAKGQASILRSLADGFEGGDKSALFILLAILLVFVSN